MSAWREFLKDGEYVVDTHPSKEGLILLTNQRLLVIVPTLKELKQDIPLESIKEVTERNKPEVLSLFGWKLPLRSVLNISTKETNFVFDNVLYYVSSAEGGKLNFQEKILQQIKERRLELERQKTSVVIDFSFLKTYIEKGGIVLTTLKCPNCSAPIEMPKGGAETVCDHCGSRVYAQDIFEKVKKLIE